MLLCVYKRHHGNPLPSIGIEGLNGEKTHIPEKFCSVFKWEERKEHVEIVCLNLYLLSAEKKS